MNKDSQHGGTACCNDFAAPQERADGCAKRAYVDANGRTMTEKRSESCDGVTGATTTAVPHHALRFQSLYNLGRGFAFPCDSAGSIDFSQLSEKARVNYNVAMNEVGHSLAIPFVQETDWQPLVR